MPIDGRIHRVRHYISHKIISIINDNELFTEMLRMEIILNVDGQTASTKGKIHGPTKVIS